MQYLQSLHLNSTDASSSDTAKNPDSKKSSRSSSREEMSEDSKTRRRKERRKKKHTTSVPKLRRKTSKIGNAAKHYLQTILMSYFQAFDPTSVGLCTQDDFWNVNKLTKPLPHMQ